MASARGRHMASPDRTERSSRHRNVLNAIVGTVVFLTGATLFLYPIIGGWVTQQSYNQVIEQAARENVREGADGALEDGNASEKKSPKDDSAYAYLAAYNQRVRDGEAGPINDPWGLGSNEDELADVGLADGIVGSVTVPSMGVYLPIYLGSTSENLNRGATLVAGTSAPLGEKDSNVVLAAHRGYGTNGLFRNIEDVQVGDLLEIDTPWDTLTYRAVETRVVGPTDADSVAVQPGRDLVTLLTCHPYGTTRERYLAIFERTNEQLAPEDRGAAVTERVENPLEEALRPSDSPSLVVERWARVVGLVIMVLMATYAIACIARSAFQRLRQ